VPAGTPVTAPVVTLPIHEKLLAALDVSGMLSGELLHVLKLLPLVKAGPGSTLTVTVAKVPTHPPLSEVGITEYTTVPTVELLGLVSV